MKKIIIFLFIAVLVITACPEDIGEKGKIETKTYYSQTTGVNRKCNVYTPPNYDPALTYPVLYLLHGIGGDHTEWMDANPNTVLSKLINEGKAPPMIAVMPNARAMVPDTAPASSTQVHYNAFYNFYNDLRDDLMPFIKENYSVSEDRSKNAVAGLSMGGMTALHVMLKMPESFGYIGAFSSAPSLPQYTGDYSQMDLPSEYKDNTFIYISCGKQDSLLMFSQGYNSALNNNGVTTHYTESAGGHDMVFWRKSLNEFARLIFKTEE